MQEWFGFSELANLRPPGLPRQRANIRKKAQREKWVCEQVTDIGGTKTVCHISSLPPETQNYLYTQGVSQNPDGSLTVATSPQPSPWQGEGTRAKL